MRTIVFSTLLLSGLCGCFSTEENGGCTLSAQLYGYTPDGARVDLYTIRNARGLEITVMTLGATLTTVTAPDRSGRRDVITLHKKTFAEYVKGHPLFGSVVGRYANRIAGARFTIDDREYALETNAGRHILHGGGRASGFAWQVWEAEPLREENGAGVKLVLRSPDGQAGFPGNLTVTVVYKLTDDNRLVMDYRAVTDKPTHLNLTNHAYWNLSGADSGKGVAAHRLMLTADRYLVADAEKLPTGEIASVAGTPMDFRTMQTIGSRAAQTPFGYYDHCYVLGNAAAGTLSLCARVADPESGRTMTLWTTQPGVQLYTGNKNGFCLETQHFPDAPNQPAFPSTLLRPGAEFHETTVHAFGWE